MVFCQSGAWDFLNIWDPFYPTYFSHQYSVEACKQFLALLLENYIRDANHQMTNAIYPLQIHFLSTYLMKHRLQEYLIKTEHVFAEGKLVKVN